MKIHLILTAVICMILILFPLCFISYTDEKNNSVQTEITQVDTESISVFLVADQETVDIKIFDYIVGAVASEMPASYEVEALKAQAVACYSYMLWVKENSDNAEYDITNDPSTHQGYLTEEEMKEKWGDKYESYKRKIEEAVSEVFGEYMTYEGEVILALYHAISPGKTQESRDVWESPLPYIKSKTAPGDSLSPDFDSEITVSCNKIRKLFDVDETVKSGELIDIFSLSDSRFIKNISVGNVSVTAGELAAKLSLPSPYFTAEYKEGNYIFFVKGYGHGLGMSQYSADYMARQASKYDEILRHFYDGVKIEKP